MKVLIFGGGDLAQAIKKAAFLADTVILTKGDCDVRDYQAVGFAIRDEKPDYVVCTAGISDRVIGTTMKEVIDVNLYGAMNVGTLAAYYRVPCVLIASTAGIVPGIHAWYGAAKAGVINFVRAMGAEHKIWAVSPGRMDTKMRQDDWPFEDPKTRLRPSNVASLVCDIFDRECYAPGANVIIRKVGLERVDIYEEVAPCLPSLL